MFISQVTHCKQFSIYVLPVKIQPSLTSKINLKKFIKQNYNVLAGIIIFCTVLDAALQLQHREHYISKRNYEISVVQVIHISKLELRRQSLEYVIFFSKVYILDLGLKFGKFLLGSCNLNLNQTDKFSVHIFPSIKS